MKRRTILKALSGSVVSGVALSGGVNGQVTTEESPHAHLRDEYGHLDTVIASFHEYADGLLEQLYDEDLVDTRDISQFASVRHGGLLEEQDGVHVMSTTDEKTDTPTAVLRVTEEFEDGTTNVFVLPEAGRSYATIEYDDGTEVLKTVTSESEREAETSDATTEETCELQNTTFECTSEECGGGSDCEHSTTPCVWTYYVRETWNHYECTEYNQTPSGPVKETYQTKELVDTTCSTNCCTSLYSCALCPTSSGC